MSPAQEAVARLPAVQGGDLQQRERGALGADCPAEGGSREPQDATTRSQGLPRYTTAGVAAGSIHASRRTVQRPDEPLWDGGAPYAEPTGDGGPADSASIQLNSNRAQGVTKEIHGHSQNPTSKVFKRTGPTSCTRVFGIQLSGSGVLSRSRRGRETSLHWGGARRLAEVSRGTSGSCIVAIRGHRVERGPCRGGWATTLAHLDFLFCSRASVDTASTRHWWGHGARRVCIV